MRATRTRPSSGTWSSVPAKRGKLSKDKQIRQTDIPEPLTMAGLLMGIGGLVGYARKRRAA